MVWGWSALQDNNRQLPWGCKTRCFLICPRGYFHLSQLFGLLPFCSCSFLPPLCQPSTSYNTGTGSDEGTQWKREICSNKLFREHDTEDVGRVKEKSYNHSIDCLKDNTPVSWVLVSEKCERKETLIRWNQGQNLKLTLPKGHTTKESGKECVNWGQLARSHQMLLKYRLATSQWMMSNDIV